MRFEPVPHQRYRRPFINDVGRVVISVIINIHPHFSERIKQFDMRRAQALVATRCSDYYVHQIFLDMLNLWRSKDPNSLTDKQRTLLKKFPK